MSGGKYTTESGTFALSLPEAILDAIINVGVQAVTTAATAVEMEKLLLADKKEYRQRLAAEQADSAKAMTQFEENLSREVEKLREELLRRGIAVPALNGSARQQLQRLYEIRERNPVNTEVYSGRVFADISLEGAAGAEKLLEQICRSADPLIAGRTRVSEEARHLKASAISRVHRGLNCGEELEQIYSRLCTLISQARKEEAKDKSRLDAFNRELARAKALCHMTNTLTPYPVFSPETADEAILRLKELSRRQLSLLEQIRQDPALRMSPQQRQEAKQAVSLKICAQLEKQGVKLRQVTQVEQSSTCLYDYGPALLKVTVACTGVVTFEVLGDPERKSGFHTYDRKRVLEAMQNFQRDFPRLQQALSCNQVELKLHQCAEPRDELVAYEVPELLTQEERSANEAAVLAMLQSARQARYAGGEPQ